MKNYYEITLKFQPSYGAPKDCVCCLSPATKKRTLTTGLELLPGEYLNFDFFLCKKCNRHIHPFTLSYLGIFIGVFLGLNAIILFFALKWFWWWIGILLIILGVYSVIKARRVEEKRWLKKHPECICKFSPFAIIGYEKDKTITLGFKNPDYYKIFSEINKESKIVENKEEKGEEKEEKGVGPS